MIVVPMTVTANTGAVPMTVNPTTANLELALNVIYENAPAFAGAYEYTPTNSAQVIPILGRRATQNITINPIPSNYGLITWNGATLTVS